MVSVGPEGHHRHSSRDARPLASGRLSSVLTLEVALIGRAAADDTELRALIRRMSMENPLWGAPRIHGELLKLGFAVAQSSVARYMVKRHAPMPMTSVLLLQKSIWRFSKDVRLLYGGDRGSDAC
jgi:hypothetical protein